MSRNIRLDLEYDGRNYCGWQWQPKVPSIEKTVKEAVERIIGHEVTLHTHGRTDAGVHAEQHPLNFFTNSPRTCIELLRGLNAVLPDDIVVYRVLDMPPDWSARHDPDEREYRYTYYNDLLPSVFWRHRAFWMRKKLDIPAMQAAAAELMGKHDFSAFRSLHCEAENPVRTLHEVTLYGEAPLYHLKVRGHAFLRHQVRIIAGTLLHIGMERMQPDAVPRILAAKERSLAGPTLPGHGLTLVAVRYPGDEERFQNSRIYAGESGTI